MNIKENFIQNVSDIENTLSFWKDKITALKNSSPSDLNEEDKLYLKKINRLKISNESVGRMKLMPSLSLFVTQIKHQLSAKYIDLNKAQIPDLSTVNPDFGLLDPIKLSNTARPVNIAIPAVLPSSNFPVSIIMLENSDDYIENSASITIKIAENNGQQELLLGSDGETLSVEFTKNNQLMVIVLSEDSNGNITAFVYEDLYSTSKVPFANAELNTRYGGKEDTRLKFNLSNSDTVIPNSIGGRTVFGDNDQRKYSNRSKLIGKFSTVAGDYNKPLFHDSSLMPDLKAVNSEFGLSHIKGNISNVTFNADVLVTKIYDAAGLVTGTTTITALSGYTIEWAKVVDVEIGARGFTVTALKANKLGSSFYAIVKQDLEATITVDQIPVESKSATTDSNTGFYIFSSTEKVLRSQNDTDTGINQIVYDVTSGAITQTAEVPLLADPLSDIDTVVEVESEVTGYSQPPSPSVLKLIAFKNINDVTIRQNTQHRNFIAFDITPGTKLKGFLGTSQECTFAAFKGDDIKLIVTDTNFNRSYDRKVAGILDVHVQRIDGNSLFTVLGSGEIFKFGLSGTTGYITQDYLSRLESKSAVGMFPIIEDYKAVVPGYNFLYNVEGDIVVKSEISDSADNYTSITETYHRGIFA